MVIGINYFYGDDGFGGFGWCFKVRGNDYQFFLIQSIRVVFVVDVGKCFFGCDYICRVIDGKF